MGESGVLSIVCSNNSEVLRLLDSLARNPAHARRLVGSTAAELRTLVRSEAPDLVILDAELPDGSGYELCREIKSDDSLSSSYVILVPSNALDEESSRALQESGANDCFVLPIHDDDFDCHISQCTALHSRAVRRVAADMQVVLERNGVSVSASVLDLTANGLGLRVASPLDLGPVSVTLNYEDEVHSGIEAKVIWSRDAPDGTEQLVGLSFGKLPHDARALLVKLSLFQVTNNDGGYGITVSLQGGFDENTDLGPLLDKVRGASHIDFMMQGVTYLSSCGVRTWCLFIEALGKNTSYAFRNCSLPFASQAAMVPMTIGEGDVLSMQAPFFCDSCDREESRIIESNLVRRTSGDLKPPPMHCQVCKKALVFDDIPSRYFAFLRP